MKARDTNIYTDTFLLKVTIRRFLINFCIFITPFIGLKEVSIFIIIGYFIFHTVFIRKRLYKYDRLSWNQSTIRFFKRRTQSSRAYNFVKSKYYTISNVQNYTIDSNYITIIGTINCSDSNFFDTNNLNPSNIKELRIHKELINYDEFINLLTALCH